MIRNKVSRLRSSGYPNRYGSNQQCAYIIEKAGKNMCRFEMEFVHLDLELSRDEKGNCNKDFLQLPDRSRVCGDVSERSEDVYKSIMHTFFSINYQQTFCFYNLFVSFNSSFFRNF